MLRMADAAGDCWPDAQDEDGAVAVATDGPELRPYQRDALGGDGKHPGIRAALARSRSAACIMATGTGKTFVFGTYAKERIEAGGRVLILAHRDNLLVQAQGALDELGVLSALEKGRMKARESGTLFGGPPNVVVGSVGSLKGRRLASWDRDYFTDVIDDECHHGAAQGQRDIFEYFRSAKVLGFSATWDRADGQELIGPGQLFEELAYEYDIRRATEENYLCQLDVVPVAIDPPVDISRVRAASKNKDLKRDELDEIICRSIGPIVKATIPQVGNRPTVVFTPNVLSAQLFAAALISKGLDARAVWGDSPTKDEDSAAFKRREYQYICNNDLLTEGWDARHVECIVPCRPTKSRTVFTQMIGRGTRLSHETLKRDCRVLDFIWLTGAHKLIKPVDLFSAPGGLPQDVEDIVARLMREGERNPKKAVDDAWRMKSEADEERARIKAMPRRVTAYIGDGEVRYVRRSYTPFYNSAGVADIIGIPNRDSARFGKRAHPGQVRDLESFGVQGAAGMSFRGAEALIAGLSERRSAGKASFRQVATLLKRGVDERVARELPAAQASELIHITGGR